MMSRKAKGIDSGYKLSELLSGRGAHIIAVAGKNLSMSTFE